MGGGMKPVRGGGGFSGVGRIGANCSPGGGGGWGGGLERAAEADNPKMSNKRITVPISCSFLILNPPSFWKGKPLFPQTVWIVSQNAYTINRLTVPINRGTCPGDGGLVFLARAFML